MSTRIRRILLAIAAMVPIGIGSAAANPLGSQVVGGSANVQGQGTANVTVNQSTNNAIINWQSFNIGTGERTNFVQPSAGSVTLNRVTGVPNPSVIDGTLTANGRIFLVNPDGILFGAGAVINTGGFLATTNDIKNSDFMAGRYRFNIPGRPDASIVNLGTITASGGGFAALVAPGVRNSGTITATLGTVALAAGNSFTLDLYGDRLITLAVGDQIANTVRDVATGQPLRSLVTNTGRISANGGRVELTAAAARQVVNSVINTSGVIEANSVGTRNGMIVLGAAGRNSWSAETDRKNIRHAVGRRPPSGRAWRTHPGHRREHRGRRRPHRRLRCRRRRHRDHRPDRRHLGPDRDTSRPHRLVGLNGHDSRRHRLDGDHRRCDHHRRVGDAAGQWRPGDGVVRREHQLRRNDPRPRRPSRRLRRLRRGVGPSARLHRRGGSSGAQWRARHAAARPRGLLHPDQQCRRAGGRVVHERRRAAVAAAERQVRISTNNASSPPDQNGDIFVNNNITWNGNSTLTLSAFRDITVATEVIIRNIGAGSLVLRADNTGIGAGRVNLGGTSFGTVNFSQSTGTVSIYYDPVGIDGPSDKYQHAIRYDLNGSVVTNPDFAKQLTAYMLVNDANDLRRMDTNLGGFYALGNNINATGFSGLPGSTFTGLLDGNGGLGQNYTISKLSSSVGLFDVIGAAATVRNLNFVDASILATGLSANVGVLAGQNEGTIVNVSVSGTIGTENGLSGVLAGGLVGQNQGTIIGSSSAVNVTVGDASGQFNIAGGLVGSNLGTIMQSSASGTVAGGANSFVGGLVGQNVGAGGLIAGSSASGAVSVTTTSTANGVAAGGLVGFNSGLATITGSFASGSVSGSAVGAFAAANIGGLVGSNDPNGIVTLSYATGNITGGNNTTAGGLVGFNQGMVSLSSASGIVTGGSSNSFVGGLVGQNFNGTIDTSSASGNVSGGSFAVGGLVGGNTGTITNSNASGSVTGTGTNSDLAVGGLAGENFGTITGSFATGPVASAAGEAGGLVGSNMVSFNGPNGFQTTPGLISNSYATGAVNGGNLAGGLVGSNEGTIVLSQASGNVTVGDSGIAGGLAGSNSGPIQNASASGAVTGGSSTILGGLVGFNGRREESNTAGTIVNSSATGAVQGVSDSYLGGLVGINAGLIQDSFTAVTSTVTGTGSHNFAGGMAGVNFGNIDPSNSAGNVISGPGSTVGGFVGALAAIRLPDGTVLIGTISPDSSGSGSATGGPGSTVGSQVGQNYPVSGLPGFSSLSSGPCNGSPFCGGTLFNPFPSEPTVLSSQTTVDTTQAQFIRQYSDQSQTQVATIDLTLPPTVGAVTLGNTTNQPPRNGGSEPPAIGDPNFTGVPPPGETRFASNELALQFGVDYSEERLLALLRRLNLTLLSSQRLELTGRTLVRLGLPSGVTVVDTIITIEAEKLPVIVTPNYWFVLAEDANAPVPTTSSTTEANEPAAASSGTADANPGQYMVDKLRLVAAHRLAKGDNVLIAVVDSGVDAEHPDIAGAVADRYNSVAANKNPDPHGTGMAGAIASHRRLLGVAPGAKLLTVRAFAPGSTEEILERHRLGGRQGRPRHQHELCRPARSHAAGDLEAGAPEGRAAGRGRRQCRAGLAAALSGRRPQRHRGDGDRHGRQPVHPGQSRALCRHRGARRRHPGAGPERRLSADHRDLGRHRPCQRRRGAPDVAQPQARCRRRPGDPAVDREGPWPQGPRRPVRLGPDRSRQGAAGRRSAGREGALTGRVIAYDEDRVEDATAVVWCLACRELLPPPALAAGRDGVGGAARSEQIIVPPPRPPSLREGGRRSPPTGGRVHSRHGSASKRHMQ